jgi:hypothetical protein
MMQSGAQFTRMLIGLPQSASDYAAVRAAAELAEALGINLSAAFIDDPTLLTLAQYQGVRELRAFGSGWRALDPAQMIRDLERAAVAAERLFTEAVKARRIETRFDIVHGEAAELFGSLAQAGDILAVVEPRSPTERITRQFTSLLGAALRTPAPVMLVPGHIVRTRGPIVAVAQAPDDPSIRTATAVADLTNEQLVVLNASAHAWPRQDTTANTRKIFRGHMSRVEGADGNVSAILEGALKGRLLVLTRPDNNLTAWGVPRCQIPVLMIPESTEKRRD